MILWCSVIIRWLLTFCRCQIVGICNWVSSETTPSQWGAVLYRVVYTITQATAPDQMRGNMSGNFRTLTCTACSFKVILSEQGSEQPRNDASTSPEQLGPPYSMVTNQILALGRFTMSGLIGFLV
ncbi:hypothetical protein K438DRAFT_1946225 [Mycena galopus ATCC 62051]|nr:hypothetical protein K438DRAFT_1946225 [Mycena galopus ATCC 62051]